MTAIEEMVRVGEPLPRITEAVPGEGLSVIVTWAPGTRAGKTETVDLAPIVMTHRYFRPLRHSAILFATLAKEDDGSALIWNGGIDMAAVTVERLAAQNMTGEEFRTFLGRHRLTLDSAAAALGISRRQVAYFAKGRPVPRLVALACLGYEAESGREVEAA